LKFNIATGRQRRLPSYAGVEIDVVLTLHYNFGQVRALVKDGRFSRCRHIHEGAVVTGAGGNGVGTATRVD